MASRVPYLYNAQRSALRQGSIHLVYFYSELNELRKPTSDNPDILRFFRYMRAAKDGQVGMECKYFLSKKS